MAVRGPVSERGPALLGRMSDSEPFDGTRATGGATDENTNERAPNQKTSGRNGLCPEGTTKISILSGRNRFKPDEILIEGQKIKATGLLPVKRTGIYAKESGQFSLVGLFEERRLPTLPPGRAVPSAMTGLASLFGMGRGGSPSL